MADLFEGKYGDNFAAPNVVIKGNANPITAAVMCGALQTAINKIRSTNPMVEELENMISKMTMSAGTVDVPLGGEEDVE